MYAWLSVPVVMHDAARCRYKEAPRENEHFTFARQAEQLRHMSHMGALSMAEQASSGSSGGAAARQPAAPERPQHAQQAAAAASGGRTAPDRDRGRPPPAPGAEPARDGGDRGDSRRGGGPPGGGAAPAADGAASPSGDGGSDAGATDWAAGSRGPAVAEAERASTNVGANGSAGGGAGGSRVEVRGNGDGGAVPSVQSVATGASAQDAVDGDGDWAPGDSRGRSWGAGATAASDLLPKPSAGYSGGQRKARGPGEGGRRPAAGGPAPGGGEDESDLHAQCMAEMDDEQVFGRGAQRRREQLEASPFFGEVCSVLREMGETARPGGCLAGGVLGDLMVTQATPPPICLQLLDEKQMVAVVPRDQARCTPEDRAGGDDASEGMGVVGRWEGLCWEADGVARWYARQLSRSARVAVVNRVQWRQWGAARRRRELGERLGHAARGVVAWGGGRHMHERPSRMLGTAAG